MKLILAQGNPGQTYDGTRHNVGFFISDRYVAEHGGAWKERKKFGAVVSELTIGGVSVVIAKPTTYYNETGRSARAIADFYKLDPATDILVIHDELALPFGTVRTRSSGSDAGNNGIKSLNAALGQTYARIRIGIWNDLHDRIGDTDFVVGRFSREENDALERLYPLIADKINAFITSSHTDETIKL